MTSIQNMLNKKIFFISLISFGVIIRLIPLLTKGTSDVDEMISWIEKIEVNGWSGGYSGIYFPSSYLIFYIVYKVSQITSGNVFLIFAFVRFLFEIIFLATLLYAVRNKFISKKLLVLLWLNPLFIVLSFAGYTDIFSLSMWFLFVYLVYKSQMSEKNKVVSLIFLGTIFAFFAYLKPQTIYLALLTMFFLALYYLFNQKNLKILIAIFLGFFVAFLLYGKLLNPPTILDCGEKFGPITISSFSNPPEVYWNKCLEKDNVKQRYPATGPQPCIDAAYEAYAPQGEAGYCVKEFKFTDSFVKEVYIIPGLMKLTKQVAGTSDVMPSYSANMPNIWAIYVKNANFYDSNKEVWRYYATKDFNNIVIFINIFLIFLLTLYLFFINRTAQLSDILILIALPITILVPNFATMAHENHFALGSLVTGLTIGVLSRSFESKNKLISILFLIWLIINLLFAANILQLYVADIWIMQSENQALISLGTFIKEFINPYLNIYQISYATTLLFVTFLSLLTLTIFRKRQKDKISL